MLLGQKIAAFPRFLSVSQRSLHAVSPVSPILKKFFGSHRTTNRFNAPAFPLLSKLNAIGDNIDKYSRAMSSQRSPYFLPRKPESVMYGHQEALPYLPVPGLRETCDKYLDSIQPLCLNEEEFKQQTRLVDEFAASGGVGEKLHARLLKHAERQRSDKKSWLEDWWNADAYLGYRDPVVIYVSYFYVFHDYPATQSGKTQNKSARKAAELLKAALEFRELIIAEKLQPEKMADSKRGSVPLDMSQYQWMFNSCRYPKKPADTNAIFDASKNTHVAVVRKNKFFTFDVKVKDRWLSTAEIEGQLQKIIAAAGDQPGPAIGALTTENRDKWTEVREKIIQCDSSNLTELSKIESAILLICLDDSKPASANEASRNMWHGDGRNRYFDKSIQLIVCENGIAGLNGEHSMMDGTPTTQLCDFMLTRLNKGQIDHGPPESRSNLTPPAQIKLVLNDDILGDIRKSEKSFSELVNKHDLELVVFKEYGKDAIKKFRLSPDAFAQMVIQLAYRRLKGISRPTYESAQTRQFLHGRTETCRTVSTKSVGFVESMDNPNVMPQEKYRLLVDAVKGHTKYMSEAVKGLGVDRCFKGLGKMVQPNEAVPALFQERVFKDSCHWYLSTSQLSSEHFAGYGWGEVVEDGFGVAYSIMNKRLQFNVTALKGMGAKEMRDAIEKALNDLGKLCQLCAPPAVPKSKL